MKYTTKLILHLRNEARYYRRARLVNNLNEAADEIERLLKIIKGCHHMSDYTNAGEHIGNYINDNLEKSGELP